MDLFEKLNQYKLDVPNFEEPLKVNSHIHTPFSFSAFNSVAEAAVLAIKENIQILGINDFYTIDGYDEFNYVCRKNKIYPLFNIEFMALDKDFQKNNIRVNDPSNPGRIYFCGKGLDYPVKETKFNYMLNGLQNAANEQIKAMINKLNCYLKENSINIEFSFDDIQKNLAKNLVRERHISKAIRIAIQKRTQNEYEYKAFLKTLYKGNESTANIEDNSSVENEIRNKLLKKGGPAFVPEDESAFLNIQKVIEYIYIAGGIPCYPVLLDDNNGKFTEFEENWDKMYDYLIKLGINCIELIPGRNGLEILEKFVNFFYDKGFIVLMGTEHNTPEMIPLTVMCRNNMPLSDNMLKISFDSACVVVAHQYLRLHNEKGYVNKPDVNTRNSFIEFGKAVLNNYLKN
jgi:hypothetical protein